MKKGMLKSMTIFLSLLLFFLQIQFCAVAAIASVSITPGSYYIKNADSGKYMQPDDAAAPNYSSSGTFMELWPKQRDTYQRWKIVATDSGYYKIINEKNGYALSVQSSYQNTSGKALVQEAYTGATRQQWNFTISSRGYYVIRPRSSLSYSKDWCMCAGNQFLGITNGLNVEQKEYSNNSNVKDEWILEPYSALLLSITNTGHDHYGCLASTKTQFNNNGYSNCQIAIGVTYASDVKNHIKNNQIFTSRSHGGSARDPNNNSLYYTYILLNNSEYNPSTAIYLYSHYNANVGIDGVYFDSSESLSTSELVVFVGCLTGDGGVGANNLPTAMVNRGATTAIGFNNSIECYDASQWTIYFYTRLLAGDNVTQAANIACGYVASISSSNVVICGNASYKIKG